MVTGLGIAALVVAVGFLLGAVRILQAVRPLFVNAVVGLLVFLVVEWAGVGVQIDWITLAIVAIGGLPGAILVVPLSVLDVAFVPTIVGVLA